MTMSQTEWAELVAKWRASRQSAREFAIAHGVADSALRYWAGRLTRERPKAAPRARSAARPAGSVPPSPPLARVVRPGEAPPAGRARLTVVVGKATVVVEPGFDASHLREVVRALSEVG